MWNMPTREQFDQIPRLYETENIPTEDKLIYLHFFIGSYDWFIAEYDGDDLMGRDVLETIHYFGERNKLFKIHLHNVERPLPHHRETFLDDGCMDMYKVMKALREVNNNCVIIDDHHPPGTIGGWMVGKAFQLGYIRALLEQANEEVG
ncbi:hypothetical protein ACFL1R_04340 [Candidatus Latescibacterota bacterium]